MSALYHGIGDSLHVTNMMNSLTAWAGVNAPAGAFLPLDLPPGRGHSICRLGKP
jgi:hypothetical protein